MRKYPVLLIFLIIHVIASAQNTITVIDDSSNITISKNIYGHFAEHLGHLIYGGLYVGESNKQIPNTEGIRNDIISALKKLKVPVLRWPGGCFADTYHWKDGIGKKEMRPSIVNTNWGGVTEDNSFGTHDFLNLCEQIGAEPYISGNVGSGSVQELADWVQYVNFRGKSRMSDQRKDNGRSNPWSVKYWGIGNEAWGCGGNMTPEHYADVFRTYTTFMSNVSSTKIFKIASGASDDDYHWTETLMKSIPLQMLEGLAIHHYSVIDWNHKGSAVNFSDEQYFLTMKKALQMDELVSKHSAVMDKYDPLKKVALVVDEWGGWYDVEEKTNPGFLYQQNSMRDAMIAGVTLNIFNNHAERVRMANLAQVVNVLQSVILTQETKMITTPTYHVMEMYNVHQNAKLIPLKIKSNEFGDGEQKLKSISASASKDSTGTVHISIVNVNNKNSESVNLILGKKYNTITGRILSSKNIQDHNSFDNPFLIIPVAFKAIKQNDNEVQIQIPPFSVVVLELR